MKRIIQAVCLTALLAAVQSASAIVRDRHDWMPSSQVESTYPADAEASFNLPALESYADRHEGDKERQAGDSFPVNVAGVVIDD